jgi:uncharacterized FAD-dependent dehydrogenase
MKQNYYDVCIIGAGVAGVFAALKIAKEHKDIKTILIEAGERPSKRRHSVYGFLGVLPTGDGKIYLSDIAKVSAISGVRKANSALTWFNNYTSKTFDQNITVDNGPRIILEKKIKKAGFIISKNDNIQLYPKDIHALSKIIVNDIENKIETSFNNEVLQIIKTKKLFTVKSSSRDIVCKKIILCAGRGGWRWVSNMYKSFNLVDSNDISKFGIRIEANASLFKDWNKSSCTILNKDIELGPFSWNGTVIPEDHIDMAISSFRSNEIRWKTDKVSFNLIGNRIFKNNGFEQTNRIGQLTFILANDRVAKEKISYILNGKSKISIIPEYNWLQESLEKINTFMPDVISKGYFHIPTILPLPPKIKIAKNMEIEINNMFVAGESAGEIGILSAVLTGLIAADAACK